jgi:rhodanese-related sulfurtransferase
VDLQELELTYAPPYGSAKDVVNMAGYVAQNLIEGQTQTVQWHEVKDLMDAGVLFVDVRNNLSENAPSLPGSIRMPLDSIRCNMYKLPQDKDIVVFCDSGQTSYNAEVILREAGFKVRNFNGSHMLYSKLVEEGVL